MQFPVGLFFESTERAGVIGEQHRINTEDRFLEPEDKAACSSDARGCSAANGTQLPMTPARSADDDTIARLRARVETAKLNAEMIADVFEGQWSTDANIRIQCYGWFLSLLDAPVECDE